MSEQISLSELDDGDAKVDARIKEALKAKQRQMQAKFSAGTTGSAYAARRRAEASATQVRDGRVRSTVDVRGTVQFNIRVPPDVKNAMLEIARSEGLSISEAGEAALRLFIEMKRKGAS